MTGSSVAKPSATLASYVWLQMGGLYGRTWTASNGDDPTGVAGQQWAATLAGLTRTQIDRAIEACRREGSDWPPGAPRFKAMALGVPSESAVRFELRGDSDRSPFTRLVWTFIDSHLFRMASADQAGRMIRDAYELAREAVMRGEPMPAEPVATLEHDKPSKPVIPATAEERKARIAAARAELSGRDMAAGEGLE